MILPKLLRTTPKEREWLYANVPNCEPAEGKLFDIIVPDGDLVDDMLYNEIRDSGADVAKQRFFRKLRLKLNTAANIHSPSQEGVDMSEFVTDTGPYHFSPQFVADEWAFEEEEEL